MAVGSKLTFSVTASDPDGDPVGYSWSATGGGVLDSGNKATATWIAPQTTGTASVQVTATDGKGGTVSHSWNIVINDVAAPILVNAIPSSSQAVPFAVNPGEEYVLSVDTSDPGGLSLTSDWQCSAGSLQNSQLNTVKWVAPLSVGPATVTISVSNGSASVNHVWYFNVSGNVVDVTDNITIPTTWASGNIYVINTRDIDVLSTLTIRPGAIVKFGSGRSLATSGSGRIEAVGTAPSSIIFTSLRDDLHGGDTNKDQNSTSPDVGDWAGVYLNSTNGNKFEYSEFYYGGDGYEETMLHLGLSSGTVVRDCTFAFSGGIGLNLLGVSSVNLARNVFYHNEKPLMINLDLSMDDSNVFHNPMNESEKNAYQGIFLDGTIIRTELTRQVTWGETEVPFVLSGWDFTINEGAQLTLQPGVSLKFQNNRLWVNGILTAQGTAPNPIVFTSVKDDQYGGDSNGDLSATSPAPGDWQGIEIGISARATLDHGLVMYAGDTSDTQDGRAAVSEVRDSSGITISNTVFAYNRRALDLLSPYSTIEQSCFLENQYPLLIGLGTDTNDTLDFQNNTYNAIYVAGDEIPGSTAVDWFNTQVPYVLLDEMDLSSTVIKLGTGTIVKVWKDNFVNVYDGAALLNWENAIFTSYRDTTLGGDVGGGGIAPKTGDWVGIWEDNEGVWLSGPNVRYAAN